MSYDAAIVQRASARLARRKEIRERRRWDLEQELYRLSSGPLPGWPGGKRSGSAAAGTWNRSSTAASPG